MKVLVVVGPTASGKTDFSYSLTQDFPLEIINGDSAQAYTPLSIGTAKPAWKECSVAHHLFDTGDEPSDLDVVSYRDQVLNCVRDIQARGKVPVIVGGSLFYLKSLLFPPLAPVIYDQKEQGDGSSSWDDLYAIDPVRAQKIHPNDRYRISRALRIWRQTGTMPSLYKPQLSEDLETFFIFIKPAMITLTERINARTRCMIDGGWLEEARALHGTAWEPFVRKKNFIGYATLFDWIARGEKQEELEGVIEKIQLETRSYAKRQFTFWRSFKEQLQQADSTQRHSIYEIVDKRKMPDVIDPLTKWLFLQNEV